MSMIDSLGIVRARIGERIAEIEERVARLKPIDIAARMEAIRRLAAEHGMAALEGLADWSAHHAMMPGSRIATNQVPVERIVASRPAISAKPRAASSAAFES